MARTGIRGVAELAGVAVGTVSNYLNHPDRVSADKARRIQAAIDEIGFVPSNAGRQLRLGVSSVIGYITPNVSNPYFTEIAESVERRADPSTNRATPPTPNTAAGTSPPSGRKVPCCPVA